MRYESAFYQPMVSNWDNYDSWVERGRETATGTIPPSLRPIFRDRDDFTAGHTLTEQTLAALRDSELTLDYVGDGPLFPAVADFHWGPEDYLNYIRKAKKASRMVGGPFFEELWYDSTPAIAADVPIVQLAHCSGVLPSTSLRLTSSFRVAF